LITRQLSSPGSGETLKEKSYFSEFFLIAEAEINFGIFFLCKKIILETYFLAIKRFWKLLIH
jgi:hypothetical protein